MTQNPETTSTLEIEDWRNLAVENYDGHIQVSGRILANILTELLHRRSMDHVVLPDDSYRTHLNAWATEAYYEALGKLNQGANNK